MPSPENPKIFTKVVSRIEDVERASIGSMDDARRGGGFVPGVGDQTPYAAPKENIYSLVGAGRKYGGVLRRTAPGGQSIRAGLQTLIF